MKGLNLGHTYRERIAAECVGTTVLDHLAIRYPHSTRSQWLRRIEIAEVLVDDHPVGPDRTLAAGENLSWSRPPWREPAAPLSFAVLYEDRDLLAVAKPAGLPTLPGADFQEHTLLARVRRYEPTAVPAHRLGRFTSGVVVFAKTLEARRRLAAAWRSDAVRRRYRALASGQPDASRFRINVPVGPVDYPPLGTVHAASVTGKRARTSVVVLERRPGSFLASVTISTGRPHQIRIHFAAAGHPLIGDPLFGPGGVPFRVALPSPEIPDISFILGPSTCLIPDRESELGFSVAPRLPFDG